jgi:hypothetical protein
MALESPANVQNMSQIDSGQRKKCFACSRLQRVTRPESPVMRFSEEAFRSRPWVRWKSASRRHEVTSRVCAPLRVSCRGHNGIERERRKRVCRSMPQWSDRLSYITDKADPVRVGHGGRLVALSKRPAILLPKSGACSKAEMGAPAPRRLCLKRASLDVQMGS